MMRSLLCESFDLVKAEDYDARGEVLWHLAQYASELEREIKDLTCERDDLVFRIEALENPQ